MDQLLKHEKILIFEPHPDDVAYQVSGSVAKWKEEGKEIMICTVTTGNNSTFDKKVTAEQIKKTMMKEHHKAMESLGIDVEHLVQWDFNDLGLDPGLDRKSLLEKMVYLIRKFKPTTVITMDPLNRDFEENPDHRTVAMTGFEAAALAAYPNFLPEQFSDKELSQVFVSRVLFYMSPEPNAFVDIAGEPFDKKVELGAIYLSQLELMTTEIDSRLRAMGLQPEILEFPIDKIWKTVCESSAKQTAEQSIEFFKKHPNLAPRVNLEYAEAYRMYYLGAVEKLREFLPKELLTL